MKLLNATSLAAVVVLAGCAAGAKPGNYECALNDTSASKCASVDQAFQASQRMDRTNIGSRQSVFEAATAAKAAAPSAPVVGAQPSGYPDAGDGGMPVFTQPKVLRAWMAPYVDANGNLRSGEYTYFATPGQWNYGDLKKAGVGAGVSGMFAPARESNLGFTPGPAAPAKAAPPAPASMPPVTQGAGSVSPVTAAPAITQPYQRLAGN